MTPNAVTAAVSGRSAASASSESSATKTMRRRRCRRARPGARSRRRPSAVEQRVARRANGIDGRHRLLHPAEDDPARLVPLERDGHVAAPGLERDHAELQRCARARTPCPSVGCPANGSSKYGVKIRIRTLPPLSGGSTNTVSLNPISSASACIVVVVEPARVGEDRELVSGQGRVGEDVGDDVAERLHRGSLRLGRPQGAARRSVSTHFAWCLRAQASSTSPVVIPRSAWRVLGWISAR